VTFASRVLALFPGLHLLAILAALVEVMRAMSVPAVGLLLVAVYGLPLGVFRIVNRFCPIPEGVFRLNERRFSPWWGSHQLQAVYIAFPQLEGLLQLVPGLYSAWLRLWGSRIGRSVYWTPRVEVADRSLLEVGDRVIFGHKVEVYGHVVKPKHGGLVLYVRRVVIGREAFVGAGSRIGPGVRIAEAAYVPVLSDLYPNRRVADGGRLAGPAVRLTRTRTAAAWMLRPALRCVLAGRAVRFRRDLDDPTSAQGRVLREVVRGLARTDYGRQYRVDPRDDYEAFAGRVPLVTYEALEPWVEAQMRDARPILVAERVDLYEKTSGSSGPAKYIPYPAALRASFRNMFLLWLHDLLTNGPAFETGKTWISISARLAPQETTAGGARVGLAHDLEYLEGWSRPVLRPFFILPPAIARLRDPAAFKHVAALYLLAEDPEIVSIWNPSLLTVLLDYVAGHGAEIGRDWAAGHSTREGLEFRFRPGSRERLALLREVPLRWPALLPALKLLSCWADANAHALAGYLQCQLPGVLVQGKGLLATEAPLTLPLIEVGGCVPLVNEVFFEFEPASGGVVRLHELRPGEEYGVVISQKGGLCRYRIGDRVRVTHYYRGAPCLQFTGRDASVSDLVGEKLEERFVRGALARLPLTESRVQTLVPVQARERPDHYVLLLDRLTSSPEQVARQLDAALQAAHGYRQARLLGQLDPPVVRVQPDLEERFLGYFATKGLRWGDIKPRCLLSDPSDAARLLV
jgi:acetyltransferase-like isoleucine patch superfamily enzyme